VLFDLRLKGFVPLLAHAERYLIVQSNINMLVPLVERGTLMQVTAGSLLGHFGPEARRAAEVMLSHGTAHVLASDAHSPEYRPPLLSEGMARAAQIVGERAARALVEDFPRALVEDRPIEPPLPREYRPRPIWAFWR
jgi:protein-tyrosine phosphatase